MKSAMETHVARGGGYSENRKMESIADRYKALNKYVSGVRVEDVVHVVGGFPCPVMTLYGSPHVHTSNGGYVAIPQGGGDDGSKLVYVMCPFCVLEKSMVVKGKDALVDIVAGMENSSYPWVVYTEEGYPRIMAKQLETRAKAQTHPAKKNKNNKAATLTLSHD